jgi:hypothetical protein
MGMPVSLCTHCGTPMHTTRGVDSTHARTRVHSKERFARFSKMATPRALRDISMRQNMCVIAWCSPFSQSVKKEGHQLKSSVKKMTKSRHEK